MFFENGTICFAVCSFTERTAEHRKVVSLARYWLIFTLTNWTSI